MIAVTDQGFPPRILPLVYQIEILARMHLNL